MIPHHQYIETLPFRGERLDPVKQFDDGHAA